MSLPATTLSAWEPITPRGVATFAHASLGLLLLVQLVVASFVAAMLVWFLHDRWCPTVSEAIEQMPDEGEIRFGRLDWRGDSPRLLAEGPFLAFSVDLGHTNDLFSPAHVQVELGEETVLFQSLLGYVEMRYPAGWIITFNHRELKPWWGAWQPALLAIAAGTVVVGLLLLWYALAILYTLPVWFMAFFANRDLSLPGCCRLAGAALIPGALVMALGILFYNLGAVDLVGLGFIVAGHFVLGWIYLVVSTLFLPENLAAAARKNPFAVTQKK